MSPTFTGANVKTTGKHKIDLGRIADESVDNSAERQAVSQVEKPSRRSAFIKLGVVFAGVVALSVPGKMILDGANKSKSERRATEQAIESLKLDNVRVLQSLKNPTPALYQLYYTQNGKEVGGDGWFDMQTSIYPSNGFAILFASGEHAGTRITFKPSTGHLLLERVAEPVDTTINNQKVKRLKAFAVEEKSELLIKLADHDVMGMNPEVKDRSLMFSKKARTPNGVGFTLLNFSGNIQKLAFEVQLIGPQNRYLIDTQTGQFFVKTRQSNNEVIAYRGTAQSIVSFFAKKQNPKPQPTPQIK